MILDKFMLESLKNQLIGFEVEEELLVEDNLLWIIDDLVYIEKFNLLVLKYEEQREGNLDDEFKTLLCDCYNSIEDLICSVESFINIQDRDFIYI